MVVNFPIIIILNNHFETIVPYSTQSARQWRQWLRGRHRL